MQELLKNLEKVDLEHREIHDTAVREVLSYVIDRSFIDPQPGFVIPHDFEMFTDEGDVQVRAALLQFLSHPEVNTQAVRQLTPEERLAAFHEYDVFSFSDTLCLGDYFGYL